MMMKMMISDYGDNLLIMALWLHCHCAGEYMSFGLNSFSFLLKDDCDNNNNATMIDHGECYTFGYTAIVLHIRCLLAFVGFLTIMR